MKRFIGAAILAALSFAFPAAAQDWQPVWSDEFDKPGATDPAKWTYEVGGHGWGNKEAQFYTDNRRENSRVIADKKTGRLVIEARKEEFSGAKYTSARLKSVADWTYGRMEIRAKLPGGTGTWPALWLLPTATSYGTKLWPDNGEIDIMEQVGFDSSRIHGSIHTLTYNHIISTQKTVNITLSDLMTNYHVYRLEWMPHEIRIYIDDVGYFTYPRTLAEWQVWPFDKPFALRLNLAVGGNWGGAQGIDDSVFPRSMEIDYVRVFKANSTPFGASPVALPGRVEAENYDRGGEGFAFHDTDPANNGGMHRTDSVDIGASGDSDKTPAVGWVGFGEWLTYSVAVAKAGDYEFAVRVASPNDGRKFYFEVDDKRATPDITVPVTGDWNKWQTVSVSGVPITAGAHKIRLVPVSEGFNINWFDVREAK